MRSVRERWCARAHCGGSRVHSLQLSETTLFKGTECRVVKIIILRFPVLAALGEARCRDRLLRVLELLVAREAGAARGLLRSGGLEVSFDIPDDRLLRHAEHRIVECRLLHRHLGARAAATPASTAGTAATLRSQPWALSLVRGSPGNSARGGRPAFRQPKPKARQPSTGNGQTMSKRRRKCVLS